MNGLSCKFCRVKLEPDYYAHGKGLSFIYRVAKDINEDWIGAIQGANAYCRICLKKRYIIFGGFDLCRPNIESN